MPEKVRQKKVFEITEQELNVQLKKTLDAALNLQAKKNVPRVYKTNLCVTKNQFVHVYPNGRKFLIEQNPINSEETIIREL